MWNDYAQALFFALALSGMGFGIAKLVVVLGERMIEKRHGTGGVREVIARRAKLESGLEARKGERAAELRKIEGEIGDLLKRRQNLERQIKDSQRAGDQIVRLIGEENAGTPCYIAQLVNKYVGTAHKQSQHAFIDSSWAQPQTVEVWARSMPDARAEIERRYPPAFGYAVVRMQDGGASAPVAKAG
ncbi:hypothetical protein [Azospirillum soli]|uniref:hypothetical protein n=1 Tax=Azospirillum soli TaxID=1304799 RepID=UPI001AE47B02|nr:hypothetical protein [Azospirillum soli]MBP2311782.1 hypothetical protein [Azospirillum soli]